MAKSVILYSQPSCVPCHQEEAFLAEKGVEFVVKDIRADKAALKELLGRFSEHAGDNYRRPGGGRVRSRKARRAIGALRLCTIVWHFAIKSFAAPV